MLRNNEVVNLSFSLISLFGGENRGGVWNHSEQCGADASQCDICVSHFDKRDGALAECDRVTQLKLIHLVTKQME